MCLGLSPDIEGEEMPVVMEGFDKGDRSDIVLPSSQRELLKEVVKTGKPVVLVLLNGSAIAINYAAEHVPSIVEAWYPGEFGGIALSEVLFGDENPSGKLPVTFYKSVDDLPDFKSYDMKDRTYKYFKGQPLFPFGHGLSYSNFEYSDFKFSSGERSKLTFTLENTSGIGGTETIQVYLSTPDMPGSATRSLIAFQKEYLEPSQAKEIEINLSDEDLMVIHEDGRKAIPEGRIFLSVGGKQPGFKGVADSPLTQTLTQEIAIE